MTATIVIPALGFASAALAQGGVQRGGFNFGPTSVSVAFDSGATAGSASPFADQLIIIVPTTITYTKSLRASSLQFTYTPEIELYGSKSFFNSLNHQARAAYRTTLSRSTSLDTTAAFVRTNDRSRETGSLTLVPRGRFMQGRLGAGLGYSINSATSLRFRLDAAFSDIALTPLSPTPGSIERASGVAGVGISRSLSPSHALSVGYGYVRSSSRDPRLLDETSTQSDSLNFGYRFSGRDGLSAGATFGVLRSGVNDRFSHSLSADIAKRWRSWIVSAGYYRTIAGLLILDPLDPNDPNSSGQIQDPTLVNSTIQGARLRVGGEIARRVRITQLLRWSRSPRGGVSGEFFQALAGNTSVAVRAGNTVAPYVNLNYWLQNTAIVAPTVSRIRISAGLQFYWDRLVGAPSSGR